MFVVGFIANVSNMFCSGFVIQISLRGLTNLEAAVEELSSCIGQNSTQFQSWTWVLLFSCSHLLFIAWATEGKAILSGIFVSFEFGLCWIPSFLWPAIACLLDFVCLFTFWFIVVIAFLLLCFLFVCFASLPFCCFACLLFCRLAVSVFACFASLLVYMMYTTTREHHGVCHAASHLARGPNPPVQVR